MVPTELSRHIAVTSPHVESLRGLPDRQHPSTTTFVKDDSKGYALVAVVSSALAYRVSTRSRKLKRCRRHATSPRRGSEQRISTSSSTRATALDVDTTSVKSSAEEKQAKTTPPVEKPNIKIEKLPAREETASADADATVEAFSALGRFFAAAWEVFIDVALQRGGPKGKQWEYRKGIEGMSLGSLHYEMLTTAEDSPEFKDLEKEYQEGWGVPFTNLSARATSKQIMDGAKTLGLDYVWLTFINFLQTAGLSGDLIDNIPVQNKWMNIVADAASSMAKQDADTGRRQMGNMMQNMVTGQMEKIAGAPMPVFLEGYGGDEGIYKIVIGPRSVVVVSDPVILKHILQSTQDNYTKGILSEVLEPIMGKGLIPADPVTWKLRRRAIVPGFHKKWLKSTTLSMVECADTLCDEMEKLISFAGPTAATLDMEEKFTSVSLDIIGKAVFNYSFGSVASESPVIRAVYSVLREAERRAQSVIPYWNLPGATTVLRDQKSHQENLQLLQAVLDEVVRKAMEEDNEISEDDRISLLQYLVLTKNEDVSNRQLRDDLMTLLIAGHETTAALLTWTLCELVKPGNEHFMDRLLNEIDSALEGRRPDFDDLSKLPFLRSCLIESLRLYPQPPLMIRRCINGDEIQTGPTCTQVQGSVSLLPGQDVFISTWSLHRSVKLWGKDAASFNPDRWEKPLEGKGLWLGYNPERAGPYPNEHATDFAFIPFGGGARKCVGDYFALLEAEVVLVTLLQRFTFTPSESMRKHGVGLTTGATVHTEKGLLLDVVPRVNTSPTAPPRSKPEPASTPYMAKKSKLSVLQRIEPDSLVVPSAAELRTLFTEQAKLTVRGEPANIEAIEAAYEKCREITRENSKTFYLGSQFLAPDEQQVVWAIYNWCRSTDELVDGPEAANTTMADLEAWEQKLERVFRAESTDIMDWEDLALVDGIRKFALIQRPFQDMIGGMAMDLVKKRYLTFQELEVYCYRVAGTVGVMTLPVLGFDGLQNFSDDRKEETIAAAMNLGVALQLTNILRDVGEDARRDRIYLPMEDLEKYGISEEEILTASTSNTGLHKEDKWRSFMDFQIERCRGFYDDAKKGIVGLSEINRLGVMAAAEVYGGILDVVLRNNYDNLSRRAYVGFDEKILLMGKAWWQVKELNDVAEENVRSGKVFQRVDHDGSNALKDPPV